MSTPLFAGAVTAVLDETFDVHYGIFLDRGTSLFETLESLTAEEASRKTGRCATIAAHVAHITFYLEVLERYMETGDAGRIDWREIWNRVGAVPPDEWDRLRTELRRTAVRVRTSLKERSDWSSEPAVNGAVALVAHTAYHLGAIRAALCAGR